MSLYNPKIHICDIRMVNTTEIVKKVQQALSAEDWKIVDNSMAEIHQEKGKRAQKTLIKEINRSDHNDCI